jgi:uncharacterized surface protein with fasciclin (FAS1) repeats
MAIFLKSIVVEVNFLPDIVDAVMASGMTKLVEAVKVAGLVDTLKGSGPFTVFAPTDEAFNKIPKEMDMLMKDPREAQRSVDFPCM